ncbi:MAG: ACT domain-containing protein [Clostridia bacterium]|nr:ACT domain-containing protein [Clostridia bacterium]
MELQVLPCDLSVCKVTDYAQVDWSAPFTFTGYTDEEYSLVCPASAVPDNTTHREDGWRGFRIVGTLDFSLVGILARIASLLAENGISIFALSTFNTDYVLMKADAFDRALAVLRENGYAVKG